jgi:hypothetical protein
MAHNVVSHGQDLDRVEIQYSGENWVDDYGGAGVSTVALYHVEFTRGDGDGECAEC